MTPYIVLAICACFSGVTTVLFGFGGGFVVVPLLYRLLLAVDGPHGAAGRHAMQIAVATSTCVMIFSAWFATLRHRRAGHIDWRQARPLLPGIACGAMVGAAAAAAVNGAWLRWAFVLYLGITILDCVCRAGFLARPAPRARAPSRAESMLLGGAVGAVAAFLGVGGSVMTVPLMRRRGLDMVRATALANPLSLPVGVAGAAAYAALAWRGGPALGAWHLGYVDLRALAVLVAGSWCGIRLGSPCIGRLPDGLYAKVYLGLLVAVLLAMAVT
ncbi:sulfite exporter TauE/SafE family protein [Robbsia sp. Bb-Pol-6]|uniref:Probable membrane transporter protein n=1 Tax=Robbsia betulipollinis TaxID=2981849 RepID=A0ABT3ZKQ2_9BURK|nr:sulfite exporter TauE/SafE family protein [Robbsia betulipollinis]MCY0386523.1 sulfite exporter TauE/SafE family protein [Robbsia betulipollinis]